MYRATIIGHFAFGLQCLDGQTIKTKTIYSTLQDCIGNDSIRAIDTHGTIKFLLKLPFILFSVLRSTKNVIILPAQRGIKIISPLLLLLNIFFQRNIHYIVIGGWLPQMVKDCKLVKFSVLHFHHIYVETKKMQQELQSIGVENVIVMPNFKNIPLIDVQDIQKQQYCEPYPLCTFSRVSQEKGIEVAIEAVKSANQKLGRTAFSLDIYGQIEKEKEWFTPLISQQPKEIKYKGLVASNNSVNVLSQYFMLLFPTFYSGEGLAGTLIDSMFTGLPVIATNWHNNDEVIVNNQNGFLVPIKDHESIANILYDIACHPETILPMRRNCINTASKYIPTEVIQILINQLV